MKNCLIITGGHRTKVPHTDTSCLMKNTRGRIRTGTKKYGQEKYFYIGESMKLTWLGASEKKN